MTGAEAFFAAASAKLAVAAPYLALAGTAMTIMGQRQQANSSMQADNANAIAAQNEAAAKERLQRQQAQQVQSRLRTSIAKSGATSAGTPLMVLADSAAQAEIDALNTRYSGQYSSDMYRSRAYQTSKASTMQTGASLLSGAGQFANTFKVGNNATS